MDSYLGLPLFAVWRNQESCVTSPSKVTEQELTLHLFQPFKVEYIDIKIEKMLEMRDVFTFQISPLQWWMSVAVTVYWLSSRVSF